MCSGVGGAVLHEQSAVHTKVMQVQPQMAVSSAMVEHGDPLITMQYALTHKVDTFNS